MLVNDHRQAWSKRYVIVLFLVCVITNLYLDYFTENSRNPWLDATVESYNSVYKEIEGMEAPSAKAYVEEQLEAAGESDNVGLKEAYSVVSHEIRHAGNYSDYYNLLLEQRKKAETVVIFGEMTDYERADSDKVLAKLGRLADNGTVVEVAPSRGVLLVLSNLRTDIFALFLIVVFILSLYYHDYESGAQKLLFPCPGGKERYIASKIGALAIIIPEVVLSLGVGNIVAGADLYGLGDLNRSIQSVSGFAGCGFRLNVWQAFLVFFIFKCLAYLAVALLLLALLIALKKMPAFIAASSAVIGASYLVFSKIPANSWISELKDINYIAFIRSDRVFSSYRNIGILGVPVSYPLLVAAVIGLHLVALPFLSIMLYSRGHYSESSRKMVLHASARKIRVHGLFFQEAFKIFYYNKTILLMAAGFLFVFFTEPKIASIYDDDKDMYYKKYIDEIKGDYSEEKESHVDDKLAEFERLEQEMYTAMANAEDEMQSDLIQSLYRPLLAGWESAMILKDHVVHVSGVENGGLFYSRGYEKLTGSPEAGNSDSVHALKLELLLILTLFGVYALEYRNGMSRLLSTTVYGRRRLHTVKWTTGLFVTTSCWAFVYGLWLYRTFDKYGTFGAGYSVCSMEHISGKLSGMSIGTYLVLLMLSRYVGSLILMAAMFLIQSKTKNTVAAVTICLFVFVLPLLLYMSGVDALKYVGLNPFLLGNGII